LLQAVLSIIFIPMILSSVKWYYVAVAYLITPLFAVLQPTLNIMLLGNLPCRQRPSSHALNMSALGSGFTTK
jgi:hypothetical protein